VILPPLVFPAATLATTLLALGNHGRTSFCRFCLQKRFHNRSCKHTFRERLRVQLYQAADGGKRCSFHLDIRQKVQLRRLPEQTGSVLNFKSKIYIWGKLGRLIEKILNIPSLQDYLSPPFNLQLKLLPN
jgi:hypothetical protein